MKRFTSQEGSHSNDPPGQGMAWGEGIKTTVFTKCAEGPLWSTRQAIMPTAGQVHPVDLAHDRLFRAAQSFCDLSQSYTTSTQGQQPTCGVFVPGHEAAVLGEGRALTPSSVPEALVGDHGKPGPGERGKGRRIDTGRAGGQEAGCSDGVSEVGGGVEDQFDPVIGPCGWRGHGKGLDSGFGDEVGPGDVGVDGAGSSLGLPLAPNIVRDCLPIWQEQVHVGGWICVEEGHGRSPFAFAPQGGGDLGEGDADREKHDPEAVVGHETQPGPCVSGKGGQVHRRGACLEQPGGR